MAGVVNGLLTVWHSLEDIFILLLGLMLDPKRAKKALGDHYTAKMEKPVAENNKINSEAMNSYWEAKLKQLTYEIKEFRFCMIKRKIAQRLAKGADHSELDDIMKELDDFLKSE